MADSNEPQVARVEHGVAGDGSDFYFVYIPGQKTAITDTREEGEDLIRKWNAWHGIKEP